MFIKRIAVILVVFLAVTGCGRLYYKQFIVGGDPFTPDTGIKTEHFDFRFTVQAGSSWSRAPIADSSFEISVWVYPIAESMAEALVMIQSLQVLDLKVRAEPRYDVVQALEITVDTTYLERKTPSRVMCFGKHFVPEGAQLLELSLAHSFRATDTGPEVVDTARVTLYRSEGSAVAPYDH